MTIMETLPGWAALMVALLTLAGALLAATGSLGLLRLKRFYQRVHAPTLGTTLGLYLIVAGSVICHSLQQASLSLMAVLMGFSIVLTAPITLLLLVRAALERARRNDAELANQANEP